MKKIIILIAATAASLSMSISTTMAQNNNPIELFPHQAGTVLVNKSYTAGNDLLATMTITVVKSQNYYENAELDLTMEMTDKNGSPAGGGKVAVKYDNGDLYMDMNHLMLSPMVYNHYSPTTELVGDFLSYPQALGDMGMLSSDMNLPGAAFNLHTTDRTETTNVNIYNRNLEKHEKIETPAGTFTASKITFMVDVTDHTKGVATYRGTEWFSPGTGIVRSEIRDKDDNLLDYTVLVSITRP